MLVATRKSDQNQALIDPWTAVHFGFGLAAGLMEVPWWLSIGGAVAYEVFEQQLERTSAGKAWFKTSGPESFGNAAVDVGVYAVGMYLGNAYNRR